MRHQANSLGIDSRQRKVIAVNEFSNGLGCAGTKEFARDQCSKTSHRHVEMVAELYCTTMPPLRSYLGTLGLDSDQMDDITQEVFVRLLQQATAKEGNFTDQKYRRWVFRTARKILIDLYLNTEIDAIWNWRIAEVALSQCADPGLNPEQLTLLGDNLLRLDNAFARLSYEQRRCLQLRVQGMGHREIGSSVGVSSHRAVRLLGQAVDLLSGEFSLHPPQLTEAALSLLG